MRHLPALLAALSVSASPAVAEETASAIRSFDLRTTERLGRVIAMQDMAAWLASDALMAAHPDAGKDGVRGWLVQPKGEVILVRFVRQAGAGYEAAYDVTVGRDRKTNVSTPADRTLRPSEIAAFNARQTASADLTKACRPGYNSVVAKDPERDGWLVWMLAPMVKANTIPVGGHYRYTISADGKSVLGRDALSKSCMVLDIPAQAAGQEPATAVVTHLVSPTPVETHVFLQLQSGRPLVVITPDKTMWAIDRGVISKAGEVKP
jgi:hypothetical protein